MLFLLKLLHQSTGIVTAPRGCLVPVFCLLSLLPKVSRQLSGNSSRERFPFYCAVSCRTRIQPLGLSGVFAGAATCALELSAYKSGELLTSLCIQSPDVTFVEISLYTYCACCAFFFKSSSSFLHFPVVVTYFRVAERIYVVNIVSVKWI